MATLPQTYVDVSYAETGINMTTGTANFEDSNSDHTDYAIQNSNGNITYRGSITNSTYGIYACNWDYSCNVDAAYVNWGSVDGPFTESGKLACGNVTVNPWTYDDSDYNNEDMFSVPACGDTEAPDEQLSDRISSYQAEIDDLETACSTSEDACDYMSTYNTCVQNEAWDVAIDNEDVSFVVPSGSPISDASAYESAFFGFNE